MLNCQESNVGWLRVFLRGIDLTWDGVIGGFARVEGM